MKFSKTVIESIAHVLPPNVWTSERVEDELSPLYERLKLPKGRLELMTGIRERRFWNPGTTPSQASTLAGKAVLEKTRLPKEKIDWVFHCAVCRDRLEPATAAYVHGALGLSARTGFFDISNACLGFMNGLVTAASMIESGQIDTALVLSGENGFPLVEHTIKQLLDPSLSRNAIKPFFANLTIGSGAVGALLCREDLSPGSPKLLAACARTDTASNSLCEGNSSGDALDMRTDSEALLEAGIALARATWGDFSAQTSWTPATPDHVICHQVGRRHQLRLYEALGLDIAKDFSTFETMGNVGSVSLPLTLSTAIEAGALKPGDKAALLGIGSGLSCQMAALQF